LNESQQPEGIRTLNDFQPKKVDGLEINFQEYPSFHAYPLTQVYDLLAQQQMEYTLRMFNHDSEM
jgi:hypothetical protein